MGQFVQTICISSYWYYTEALWPFIWKIGAFWVQLGCINWKASKNQNLIIFLYDCNETQYQIGFMGQSVHKICNAIYCAITQSPRDHLFQKSGSWMKLVSNEKYNKLIFIFLYDCNKTHYQIGLMGQFVHTICNASCWYHTEDPWPFISKVGVMAATWVHKLENKQKSPNLSFFLYDCNQIH